MSRVLLLCAERVRPAMAGVGIRFFEMTRTFAGRFDVTLGIPNDPEECPPVDGARVVRYEAANLAELSGAADVVVQPYVTATQSGVAQIAFHFDKPAIITDVGGLAEVVPHERAGLVVPPENPEALAAEIIRFFNEKMAARLTEGVRQEKQKYSWDRLYEAVEDLL